MRAGILLLLAVAAVIGAGAIAAGFTTRGMPTYRSPPARDHAYPTVRQEAPSAPDDNEQSWLDRELSALDIPAWPFGRDQWVGTDDPADRGEPGSDAQPYAPDRDTADLSYGPTSGAADQQQREPRAIPQRDAAAEAAARANAAAEAVIAAEGDPDRFSR